MAEVPAVAEEGSAAPATATDTYVGTAKCRMCHMAQFRGMTAFASDTTGTVRMNLNAGVMADSKAIGHGSATHARNSLQCETCHGMGSRHLALGTNRDSAARRATVNLPDSNSTCRGCHAAHPPKN